MRRNERDGMEIWFFWTMLLAFFICGFWVLMKISAPSDVRQDGEEGVKDEFCDTIVDGSDKYIVEVSVEAKKQALALMAVESGYDAEAKNGNCIGVLQITPQLVMECNRLLDMEFFTLEDRLDSYRSMEMFAVIMAAKNPGLDLRRSCQIWNPRAGEWYYRRVKGEYDIICNN